MNEIVESFLSDLKLLDVYRSDCLTVFRVASHSTGNPCPTCGQWAHRVHSLYYRTVQDLPIGNKLMVLRIRSRKFFCDNASCTQVIFTERFTGLFARSGRKTSRLNDLLTHLAFELGGNPGAAMARQMGIQVCRDTMLQRIRKSEHPEPTSPQEIRVIGIDDWAYRRGDRYGTRICDLEQHRVIDVLPDRRVATVAAWLIRHPTIQIVSRDRAGAYAQAIRQGLPHAQQVADRWHLLKNLSETVHRYLSRQRLPLREKRSRVAHPAHDDPEPAPDAPSGTPDETTQTTVNPKTMRREIKWERVQEVQQLHLSGMGKREIARRTGLSRQTIGKYLTWNEVPNTVRVKRTTVLDPYRETVCELARQSMKGSKILRHLREMGYIGSRTTVAQYLADMRKKDLQSGTCLIEQSRRRVSPREATVLVTQKESEVKASDRAYRDQLLREVKGAQELRDLCMSFRLLLDTHDSTPLCGWVETALQSQVQEMGSFARGIQKDLDAVSSGIKGP